MHGTAIEKDFEASAGTKCLQKKHMLYLCSASCITCQFPSRSNLSCWFWPLKSFMGWGWGTTFTQLHLPVPLGSAEVCYRSCLQRNSQDLGDGLFFFFAVIPALWNIIHPKVTSAPSLISFWRSLKIVSIMSSGLEISKSGELVRWLYCLSWQLPWLLYDW